MKFVLKAITAGAVLMVSSLVFAQTTKSAAKPAAAAAATMAPAETKGQTVKIAMIEGLSGAFANVGQNQLKSYQFVSERMNGAKNPAQRMSPSWTLEINQPNLTRNDHVRGG